MRTKSVTVSSATFSQWLPVDSARAAFGVAIGVTLTPSASLTYSVQHTHDDPFQKYVALTPISRSGTTVTINYTDHGLSVGDWVHVEGANTGSSDVFDGNFAVAAITDANNFTYTVTSAGATTANPDARFSKLRVVNNSVLAAQTASGDTNYAFPVRAVRLKVTTYSSGKATMTVNQGTRS